MKGRSQIHAPVIYGEAGHAVHLNDDRSWKQLELTAANHPAVPVKGEAVWCQGDGDNMEIRP